MQSYTREELVKFLQALRADDDRYRLMAVMAVRHGLRVSELTGRQAVKKVKKQRINYFHKGLLAKEVREGFITIRRLKGSETTKQEIEQRDDPLLDEKESLEKLVLITPPNQQLFKVSRATVWRHFQRAARSAGIKLSAASIRGMKHTLGTLASETTPLKKLQIQMGHKKSDSTMAYYDVTPEQAAASVRDALGF